MLLVNLKNDEILETLQLDGSSGGSSIDESRIIVKSNTIPEASSSVAGYIYQYAGATNSTYTHGYIYECKTTKNYSGTVEFTPDDVVTCSGANFVAFLQEASPTGFEDIVSGTMTYIAAGNLWVLVGKDAEDNTVTTYQVYTEDYEDAGFVFTGTYEDGDVIAFECTVTETNTYAWERIDVQPAGGGSQAGLKGGSIIQVPTDSDNYATSTLVYADGAEYNIADYQNFYDNYLTPTGTKVVPKYGVDFVQPVFASNTATDSYGTYTLSSNADFVSGYELYKAFDGEDSDYASARSTSFDFTIEMPDNVIVTGVKLISHGATHITVKSGYGENHILVDADISSSGETEIPVPANLRFTANVYKIYLTGSNPCGLGAFELKGYISGGFSYLSSNGIMGGSSNACEASTTENNHPAYYAFNGDSSTTWGPSSDSVPQTLTYYYASPVIPAGCYITFGSERYSACTVSASNDGTNYVEIGGFSVAESAHRLAFDAKNKPYQYVRFTFTGKSTSGFGKVAFCMLYGLQQNGTQTVPVANLLTCTYDEYSENPYCFALDIENGKFKVPTIPDTENGLRHYISLGQ